MTYAGLLGNGFKERGDIPLCIGKPVGKCKAIVGLYRFFYSTAPVKDCDSAAQYFLGMDFCRLGSRFGLGRAQRPREN